MKILVFVMVIYFRNEFTAHTRTPAITITATKLYPDTLLKYGIKTVTRKATGRNNVTGIAIYIKYLKYYFIE